MHVVILGGTGFIGSALDRALRQRGDQVTILSRNPERLDPSLAAMRWDGRDPATLATCIDGADAVVNLVGAGIADARWTPERKHLIVSSRVDSGAALTSAVSMTAKPPEVVIQASAVGYYGSWGEALSAPVRSEDAPAGAGFLASTCVRWEASSEGVVEAGIRRCVLRTGPVLAHDGGLLSKFVPPFRYYLGGPLGSGRQPFAWIHRSDAIRAIMHLLDHPHLRGAFNLTAPGRTTMLDFCQTLGKVLHRPCWLPVPAFALRFALGELAEEAILGGQVAPPERLVQSGFIHDYPSLDAALHDIAARFV